MSVLLATNLNDPLYIIINVVALTAIGFMIWFGYKYISKDRDGDGGIKVKV